MKVFQFVTSFLALMTGFEGKGKSKAEPPSADEMSEHMSRCKPTPYKGKAPTFSFELNTLDDEHSTTPSLVTYASIPKPPDHKRRMKSGTSH